jgi:hypothetical protein
MVTFMTCCTISIDHIELCVLHVHSRSKLCVQLTSDFWPSITLVASRILGTTELSHQIFEIKSAYISENFQPRKNDTLDPAPSDFQDIPFSTLHYQSSPLLSQSRDLHDQLLVTYIKHAQLSPCFTQPVLSYGMVCSPCGGAVSRLSFLATSKSRDLHFLQAAI